MKIKSILATTAIALGTITGAASAEDNTNFFHGANSFTVLDGVSVAPMALRDMSETRGAFTVDIQEGGAYDTQGNSPEFFPNSESRCLVIIRGFRPVIACPR